MLSQAKYRTSGEQNFCDDVPISINTTGYFYDQESAAQLIRHVRWNGGLYCPRCRSLAIKKINSFFVNEIFQCNACQYNFNCTSGTLFHGSKLRLDTHLALAVAIDSLIGHVRINEIGRLLGVSPRTAKLQLAKLGTVPPAHRYLHGSDQALADIGNYGTILELFEAKSFSIQISAFQLRLANWLGVGKAHDASARGALLSIA
ncbi:transposase [Rhizobium sp. KVB221]|uniref:Transposase n=1 Tax=Rhizobium setariae TaxID=2801340 RepID=A0A936YL91_9HYPH|nr:transposase [Rhizobium setariae]MBL0372509.1 transposase [Rhizobium setariae]